MANLRSSNIFPSDEVEDKSFLSKEGIQYWKSVAQCISNRIDDSDLNVGLGSAEMILSRLYGAGNQPVEKYLRIIYPHRTEQGTEKTNAKTPSSEIVQTMSPSQWDPEYRTTARKGFANINIEIFSYAPKISRIMLGLLQRTNTRIKIESKSPKAVSDKLFAKNQAYFAKIYGPVLQKLSETNGVPPLNIPFVPNSKQELEIYTDAGGFKTTIEIALEKIIAHTFDVSNYDKEIDPSLIQDFIDLNVGAIYDYQDPNSRAVRIGYRDPIKLTAVYINDKGFSASPYTGYREVISVYQLREELNACGESIPDHLWSQIVASNQTAVNTSTTINQIESFDSNTGRFLHDDFKVTVIRCEYTTTLKRVNAIVKDEKGNTRKYYASEPEADIARSPEKQKAVIRYSTKFEFCYLPDFDFLYGGKHVKNIKREDAYTVQSNHHTYKIKGKSITKTLVSKYDELQIIHLKYQTHIVNSKPPGVAVNLASMQDIIVGGEKYDAFDLLSIYEESGRLLYSLSVKDQKIINNGVPFNELRNGLGEGFQQWIQAFERCVNTIFDLAGITQAVAAAAAISGEKSVGGQEMEIEATNVNIKHISDARVRVKEMAAKGAALRAMVAICGDKKTEDYYTGIIGTSGIQAIKDLMKEEGGLCLDKNNIIIQASPDSQKARDLLEAAKIAMQPQNPGVTPLSYEDYFYISSCIYQDRIDEGQRYLTWKQEENKRIFQAAESARLKSEQEFAKQQQQEAAAAELEKINDEHEKKKELIILEEEEKRKTIIAQEIEKRKTIQLQKEENTNNTDTINK